MKKLFLFFVLIISFAGFINLSAQENIEELFKKSIDTKDLAEKKQIREKIIQLSPESEYGYYMHGIFLWYSK